MSLTSRAWIVAASVGAVEAMKDQGFCRWNYTFRSLQHARNNCGSLSQTNRFLSSSSSTITMSKKMVPSDEKMKQSEESLRKVMYLSC
ncbi:uncharacterized protein LOC122666054 [Telopea speciosissima]|uniref:uncharacterized protein LOC122666054 n=1 Tax=Telopea speciosissima TaxID=54955 RepID=UPI001CC48A8E|nr:uncharacterized protein LOC122666054 [Telopea speciosissima]